MRGEKGHIALREFREEEKWPSATQESDLIITRGIGTEY